MELELNNRNQYNQIIENSLKNEQEINMNLNQLNVTKDNQNQFLETTLGKTINGAIDIGLRWVLPDLIENQVIEIKDTLLENGLKDGIKKAVDTGLEFGKSALGIVTGKFDNISQVQTAVQKGGILDSLSNTIDFVLNYTSKKGMIPKDIATVIKSGQKILIDNIQNNIEKTMTNQIKGIEKIDKYISNWNQGLKEENFDKMELEYKKIKSQLSELIPLETTLKKARELENLHLLIKNKGTQIQLTQEEINLVKKLN